MSCSFSEAALGKVSAWFGSYKILLLHSSPQLLWVLRGVAEKLSGSLPHLTVDFQKLAVTNPRMELAVD